MMWKLAHKTAEHQRLMLSNCGAGEDSWEDIKEIKLVNPKGNQPWIFIGRKDWCWCSNTSATWYNRLVAKDWCWERLRVRREGDNSGWDGQMASSTQCTWACANSLTRKPGMLQSMGWQRVGHDWVTEQQFAMKWWDQMPWMFLNVEF